MGEVAGVATGAGTAGQLLMQALAPAPQPAQHARPLAIQAASNVGRAGRQAGVPAQYDSLHSFSTSPWDK